MDKPDIKNIEFLHKEISKEKLSFIISSLQKKNILEKNDNPIQDGMRLLIQNESDKKFNVHYGSALPENGGSGETFEIDKITGEVISIETETYAPMPFDEP